MIRAYRVSTAGKPLHEPTKLIRQPEQGSDSALSVLARSHSAKGSFYDAKQ